MAADDADNKPAEEPVSILAYLTGFPLSSRTLELTGLVTGDRDTVLQLRAYLAVLLDANAKFEAESPADVADRVWAARGLTEEVRSQIRTDVDRHLAKLEADAEGINFDESAVMRLDENTVLEDPFESIWQVADFTKYIRAGLDGAAELSSRPPKEQVYYWEYMRARERGPHLEQLLRSQYTVAIGLVQPMVARLLLLVMRSAQDGSEERLSREELDEAVYRQLLRGPESWRTQLKARFDSALLERAVDWEALARAWEQRNLFVHRGGLVDSKFRQRFPDSPPVGSLLELSPEDVYDAFDFAAGTRFAFLLAAAHRVAPGSEGHWAASHSDLVFDDFDKRRWRLAETTARAAQAFASNASDAAIAQVNLWLAREARLGPESIHDEVACWDPTPLGPSFTLAQLILLRRDEEAVVLLEELLQRDEITDDDLLTWQLFARYRSDRVGPFSGVASD